MRPKFIWQLRSRTLALGERTLIMGVVNVTPDSFSDGGQFFDPERAVAHALKLLAEGADILDVGGESTRPGRKPIVSAEEERRRVLPVIEGILRQASAAIISVDTYHASTAEVALTVGAEIVNDVSGFTWDVQMLSFLAENKCGCVLMHTRGRPEEWRNLPPLCQDEVLPLVARDLRRLSAQARAAGIAGKRLVLDPGFGFGKRYEENYPLLAGLRQFHQLGFPLMAGTSRKSFLAKTSASHSQAEEIERLSGTLATVTASVLQGVHLVRVHDAGAAAATVRVADMILAAS